MRSEPVIAYSVCRRPGIILAIAFCAFLIGSVCTARGQSAGTAPRRILYDETSHVFRMDSGGVSYVFGVNQNGEVQTLYWGERLQPADPILPARADGGNSAFDLPVNATPQEFVGWGGGLVIVPDLKISFPDGNRDLALRYVSHTIRDNTLIISLRDISRNVAIDLIYQMDETTGVLARSARIENRIKLPLTMERILQRRGIWAPASYAISLGVERENGICSRYLCIPGRSPSRAAVALPVMRFTHGSPSNPPSSRIRM